MRAEEGVWEGTQNEGRDGLAAWKRSQLLLV